MNFLRGIPNASFLDADGSVGTHLFYFKREFARDDGWIEQSINWEDDQNVLQFTLNQEKENGEFQFGVGAVRIPRDEIDRLNKQPTVNGILDYERSATEVNVYHGNLLLRSDTPVPVMKKIAAGIALAASQIIRRP